MAIVSKHVDEQREKDSLKRRAIELYRRLDYMLQKPVDEGGDFPSCTSIKSVWLVIGFENLGLYCVHFCLRR